MKLIPCHVQNVRALVELPHSEVIEKILRHCGDRCQPDRCQPDRRRPIRARPLSEKRAEGTDLCEHRHVPGRLLKAAADWPEGLLFLSFPCELLPIIKFPTICHSGGLVGCIGPKFNGFENHYDKDIQQIICDRTCQT